MKHGDLNKYVKYNTKVTNVTFDEESLLTSTPSANKKASILFASWQNDESKSNQGPGFYQEENNLDDLFDSLKITIFLALPIYTRMVQTLLTRVGKIPTLFYATCLPVKSKQLVSIKRCH